MRISRKRIYKILNSSSKQTRKKSNNKARKSAYNGGKRRTHSKRHGKKNLRYRSLKRQKGGSKDSENISPDERGERISPLHNSSDSVDLLGLDSVTEKASEATPTADMFDVDSQSNRPLSDGIKGQCMNQSQFSGITGLEQFKASYWNRDTSKSDSKGDVIIMCYYSDELYRKINVPGDGNCGWYAALIWLQDTKANNPEYYEKLSEDIKGICDGDGDGDKVECSNIEPRLQDYDRVAKQNNSLQEWTNAWRGKVQALRNIVRELMLIKSPKEKQLTDEYLQVNELRALAEVLGMTVVMYDRDRFELSEMSYYPPINAQDAVGICTIVEDIDADKYPPPLILDYQGGGYPGKPGGHFDMLKTMNAKGEETNAYSVVPVATFMKSAEQGGMNAGMNRTIEQLNPLAIAQANQVEVLGQKAKKEKLTQESLSDQQQDPEPVDTNSEKMKGPGEAQMKAISQTSEAQTGPPTPPASPSNPRKGHSRRVNPAVSRLPDPTSTNKDPTVTTSTVSKQLEDGSMEFTITVRVPSNATTRVDGPGGDTAEAVLKSFIEGTNGTVTSDPKPEPNSGNTVVAAASTGVNNKSKPVPAIASAASNTEAQPVDPNEDTDVADPVTGPQEKTPNELSQCEPLPEPRKEEMKNWSKLSEPEFIEKVNTLTTPTEAICAMNIYEGFPGLRRIIADRMSKIRIQQREPGNENENALAKQIDTIVPDGDDGDDQRPKPNTSVPEDPVGDELKARLAASREDSIPADDPLGD